MDIAEIESYLKDGAKLRNNIDYKKVYELGTELSRRFRSGNKLILCGNGGSAADSQHIAAEFVGKFRKERRALPALALNTNTSSLTAIGNDYDFSKVFERQIEAFAKSGDMVIGLSTSGNSPNIINALNKANSMGCYTVALTGRGGGKLKGIAKLTIEVNSSETSLIQEVHIAIGHIISKIVEDGL
ncbi:MAG: D-sedoheptulose 7-phosphate isomerase [Candidatus Micrarchaeota archaeon]|nr:D-sedoheptulose 7-phosphate isomerase [Candidatus Micrarchaeota archaeon]MDE1834143.1 D-sedoheptulose 7-phosphate isomerase [Candidatus Micrarchaeota archaeon]MDE1859530.1 D-sedoheptulose 7-phosphate isomerase [Candidatus Micrarchaeota archaeon]